MAKVLVTGGCGYIGSHTLVDLIENAYDVISVDSLINSDLSSLKGIKQITGITVKNYAYDLCDLNLTRSIFEDNPDIKSIIHFAALKSVNESVEKPYLYFKNNINSLINLLFCCENYGVENFIFSSSCTVYGNPDELPVSENSPLKEAESPYGKTKQISEKLIEKATNDFGLKAISLRYFNPAGAHDSILIGESPLNTAANLVPVITETAIGKRKKMTIYGKNYSTRDGTNIRDYIHVMDLANGHTKALRHIDSNHFDKQYDVFNLGIGNGVSVLEAVNAFIKVSGLDLNYAFGERREGDVIAIYANFNKAKKILGWIPSKNIEDIMATAWAWEQRRVRSIK